MSGRQARICCLDLDTFFVSVERIHNPALVGQPVVVGARPGQRGVVTAASYEVRAFGVRSGMAMAEAVRRAPNAIFVPTRSGAYTPYSQRVREILERYTPVVRPASIDEFYLDFEGCERLYRIPADADAHATITRVVTEIRGVIQSELGLPASAGIGTSHTIAKIASGRAKPTGTLMVLPGDERAFLFPLPVRKFPGIGPVTERRLKQAGITHLGELINAAEADSSKRFGDLAVRLRRVLQPQGAAEWHGERPAFREFDRADSELGSISNERTFSADVVDAQRIHNQLRALAERVSWRARKRKVFARTVSLKLRYADFQTLTRRRTIEATDAESDIMRTVFELFAQAHTRRLGVRLLGVGLSNFAPPQRQLSLSFDAAPRPKIGEAIDSVRAQFGYQAIRLGAVAEPSESAGRASVSKSTKSGSKP